MNPDIEKELIEIKKVVEENNKILRKIQSGNRWVIILGFVKWVVYIGIVIGVYAVLQPYINQMIGLYTGIQESADTLSEMKSKTQSIDINSLKELFN